MLRGLQADEYPCPMHSRLRDIFLALLRRLAINDTILIARPGLLLSRTSIDDKEPVQTGQVLFDCLIRFWEVFLRQLSGCRYLLRVQLQKDYPGLFQVIIRLGKQPYVKGNATVEYSSCVIQAVLAATGLGEPGGEGGGGTVQKIGTRWFAELIR